MVSKLQEQGISNFHFCTLNLEKSVKAIIDGLEWLNKPITNGKPNFVRLNIPTSHLHLLNFL